MVDFIDLNNDNFLTWNSNYKVCMGAELIPSIGIGTCMNTRLENTTPGELVFRDTQDANSRITLNPESFTIEKGYNYINAESGSRQYMIDGSRGQYEHNTYGDNKLKLYTDNKTMFVITKARSYDKEENGKTY